MKGYLFRCSLSNLNHGRILFRSYGQVKIIIRIDGIAPVQDLIVEMGSCGFARIAGIADALSPFERHSFSHHDGLHMGISCLVTKAVVDYDGISIAKEFELYTLHDAVTCCIYRISRFHREIDSIMLGSPVGNWV